MFYQLQLSIKDASTYYGIGIDEIRFYAPEETLTSNFVQNGNNSYLSLTSNKGQLHVLASEFDKNGNFVKNIYAADPAQAPRHSSINRVQESSNAAVDTEDSNWTNKVADEGQTITIEAPADTDHYIKVRAKSVYPDNTQSEELVAYVHSSGLLTDVIENIVAEDEPNQTEEAWYNLQGVRVSNPSNGVYIRVKDGKAIKIKL